MDPDLTDAKFTTDHSVETDALIEMAHARRPLARVAVYDEEGRILRRVKPRNLGDEVAERN